MIARVTIPGESIRVRLDNTFGTAPVEFGKASVGLRVRGPAVAVGLVKSLTFGGKAAVTVAPGATVVGDPGALHRGALQDRALPLFGPRARVPPRPPNHPPT